MLDDFARSFRLIPGDQVAGSVWEDPGLLSNTGYLDLASRFAGCGFENGLYRFHDAQTGPLSLVLVERAFPDFSDRVRPFAYDWLGREFAVDANRIRADEMLVLMFEPGTGEALEIPTSFREFHMQLTNLREPALAASFFSVWARENPTQVPVRPSTCVGYRVPLFLGGADVVENLEVIDLDVYWSICGELRQGTRHLPAGTSIRQVLARD